MPKVNRNSQTFKAASWAAVALMLILIFWFSAQTGENLNEDLGLVSQFKAWLAASAATLFGAPIDVSPVGHFTEYLVLGACLANALSLPSSKAALAKISLSTTRLLASTTLLCSLYGVSDELHQIFTPNRSCDPVDWLVDTVAAFLGALIICLALKHGSRDQRAS
ncbi:MAG: VanZ family protein [Coriobacteriia bacterium]|nr:VanZ family protein [Coriobacteriia bacterium]